ncbi:F-box domain-containing protein [Mycena venus]|uniref:F-box domain-containing protein n=1 Tax=Mycena venus TaxID=2733690 RepID=A0A8H6WX10_9AGAR|nr:F-box domain-containing protein [Mycena venus]
MRQRATETTGKSKISTLPSINDIPLELLSEILALLDAKTLLLCSSICNLWHETIKHSPELQLTIELWADGMVRGDSSVLKSAEALRALDARRRAWQNLEWTSKTVVEIESLTTCRAYELVGGMFAEQLRQQGPDFLAISLPRVVGDPENARVTHGIESLEDFRDFMIDPTQDLIVRLYMPVGQSAYLECRTISSEDLHPLAACPVLTFSLTRDPTNMLSIQIVDNMIGVFFPRPYGLSIFNWRTGITIMETQERGDLDLVADFHLLSSSSYILVHSFGGNFEGRQFDDGQIDIFSFNPDCSNSQALVTTLVLPELIPTAFVALVIIHTAPFCAKPITGIPFSKSNNRRIYAILILYNNRVWCRLIVHHRFFEKCILDRAQEKIAATVIPWDEWGPQNTRMLPGENIWIRHVDGERLAVAGSNRNSVQILDFGIIPRRAPVTDDTPHSAGFATELHLEPSGLSDVKRVFLNVVTTSLPYRSTTRVLDEGDEEHDSFLIDQDRIIGLKESHHRMTVYTF